MKLGIIGLPQAGKSTVFEALTGARGESQQQKSGRSDHRIGTVRVADPRVDHLSELYKPKKTTYAQVEYLLPSDTGGASTGKSENALWNQVRPCDALIQVVRNFHGTLGAPSPEADIRALEEEMIISDLAVVEKKMERMALDAKRGKKDEEGMQELMEACRTLLEENRPLRSDPGLASSPGLRGFTFLSAKPRLLIVNNDDENEEPPSWSSLPEHVEVIVVRGSLEKEIALLSPEEAEEFMAAYHIRTSALDRVIRSSYEILELISFFTVGEDEVKAWTIPKGTTALDAAGVIHSDIQQGFIRAEVISFEELVRLGSLQEAKKAGQVRLEGKEHVIEDGDIVHFRFNV
ncbi:MAG: YchF family ATPase [Deltaproteobacteria bacterium]|nr:YchF family ATPase [Deltaproteobacteria bacterium]